MLVFPNPDPVIWHLYGPFAVRWYGLMYLVGLLLAWGLLSYRLRVASRPPFARKELTDILFYAAMGMVLGGRIGYMLFYDWPRFLDAPWQLLAVWQGGMSFHGGLLGVLAALWLYARQTRRSFLQLTDFVAPVVPLGLAAGRIGNFINGELWGRVTVVPWGMVFPAAGDLPRHPSQLYECALEGVLLFSLLWVYSKKPRQTGAVSALFLIFYGLFRFGSEFFREPDVQKGYVAFGWMTQGQLLSLPMILVGCVLFILARTRKKRG